MAPTTPPLEQIPPPDVIRRRLADLARERQLLRQLLRVADRRERDLRAAQAAAPVGGPHRAA